MMKKKAPHQPNTPLGVTQGVEPSKFTLQLRTAPSGSVVPKAYADFLAALEEGRVEGGVIYWPTEPRII